MRKVLVLMSTYNGNDKIIKQVESIQNQKGVEIRLAIRDDGSNQKTINTLKKLNDKFSNIEVFFEQNLGYKKSFLKLLTTKRNEDVDYFAFSDQDDIWEDKKIIKAISKLDNVNEKVKLYTSNLNIYDNKLNFQKKTNLESVPNNIYSLFTRNRFAGCTFVMSKELVKLSSGYEKLNYPNNEMPAHDFLIPSIAYSYGKVLIDFNSYIKHIRYSTSVTSGGNGVKKRLSIEIKNIFNRKDTRLHMAELLLDKKSQYDIKNKYILNYLEYVYNYKDKISNRVRLIKYMNCGSTICNLESIFKLLIGNF